MSTEAGHSDLQPLHRRQRSRTTRRRSSDRAARRVRLRQELAEDIGPAARTVRFFQGGHVGRTHGAAPRALAARPRAVAALGGPQEAAVLVPVEIGGHRVSPDRGAEITIEGRRIQDLLGVEDPLGIEGRFDALEQCVHLGTQHALDERRAQPPVAVLPREGTAIFGHQIGDLAGNRSKPLAVPGVFEIELRPEMQKPDGGMTVIYAAGPVLLHERLDARHILGQIGEGHGRVFDHGDGLAGAGPVHQ